MTLLRKYVFFPDFTDFERAVTLLLVKIILNFKNYKKPWKALFKTFDKFFRKMKSSCPKRCVNASTAPNFFHGSV